MGTGAAIAGSALVGGGMNYLGAKEQAEAQKEAAKKANEPFKMKQPYLGEVYDQSGIAREQAQRVGTPAAMQQGWDATQQTAQGLQDQGFGQNTMQFGQDVLSGKYMDPSQNQYLQGAMNAAIDPVTQNFQRQIMPQVAGDAQSSGQYGGSRQGVIEANAMNDLNRNILNTTSQMSYQNYENERQRQMQAPDIISRGAQMQMVPGTMLQDLGQQQYQQRVQEPFAGLSQQAQLLGTGPNQQTAPQPTASPTQSAISGGLGGASTATAIMKALGSSGGGGGQTAATAPNAMGSPGYGGYQNTSWYTGMGQGGA